MLKRVRTRIQNFSLQDFIQDSRAVGIVLLFCTACSLIVSNIHPMGVSYNLFWDKEIPIFHQIHLPHTVLHFINDALMAVFFFMVGLEIKREMIAGELSSKSSIAFPSIAAVSGVLFPAAIFLLLNKGTPTEAGWAIPSATDIAFSLGILAMAGKNIPYSFKIFLTALAIIDDLLAILIIAFFYGGNPNFFWLILVVFCVIVVYFIFRKLLLTPFLKVIIVLLGIGMWYAMYQSGIHATFAGVIFAMLMPMNKIPKLEKLLHTPVNFGIIPIFALANTSIIISSEAILGLTSYLSWGIILGLCVGKPLGIGLSTYYMIKNNLVEYPKEVKENWRQFLGLGMLAGIGFTMSIFVSTLAFEDTVSQNISKLAVLIASLVSMIVGFVWMKLTKPKAIASQ